MMNIIQQIADPMPTNFSYIVSAKLLLSDVAITLLCLMLETLCPGSMISDLNRLCYDHYIHVLDLILQVIVTYYVL